MPVMLPNDDVLYNFVNRDPFDEMLHQERSNRTTDALWQCKCDIGEPFLKPCGQSLRMLSGNECPSYVQLLPVALMSDDQQYQYENIKGVACWWCAHQFDTKPVGCPIKMFDFKKRLKCPVPKYRRVPCNHADECKHSPLPPSSSSKMLEFKVEDECRRRRNTSFCPKQFHDKTVTTICNLHKGKGDVCDRCKQPHKGDKGIVRRYDKPIMRTHEVITGYHMDGYFCGWPCARAYGEKHHPNISNQIGSWIHRFAIDAVKAYHYENYKILKSGGTIDGRVPIPYGYHVKKVKAAPPYTLLRMFGGSMDIDEFRRVRERDNRRELAVIGPTSNVVPCGMSIVDMPAAPSFRIRFNKQMADLVANETRDGVKTDKAKTRSAAAAAARPRYKADTNQTQRFRRGRRRNPRKTDTYLRGPRINDLRKSILQRPGKRRRRNALQACIQ